MGGRPGTPCGRFVYRPGARCRLLHHLYFGDQVMPRSVSSTSPPRHGFTLIEVMISMALVLGLILGINAVFKMAADTVGTGQALSAKMRDARAAQTVFFNDISHAVVASDRIPFLVIDSRTQAAFRDARDQENDH